MQWSEDKNFIISTLIGMIIVLVVGGFVAYNSKKSHDKIMVWSICQSEGQNSKACKTVEESTNTEYVCGNKECKVIDK